MCKVVHLYFEGLFFFGPHFVRVIGILPFFNILCRGRGRGQALTCREKLLQLKERNRAREEEKRKVEQQEGDMWDTFKGAARGSVDDRSRASSNLLPGGVMVGKFHESVLANLNSEGGLREQKELFEKFVLKS